MDGQVHQGDRVHAERTVGRVQGAGDAVVGPQVVHVRLGGEDVGAQRTLDTLGGVDGLLGHGRLLTSGRRGGLGHVVRRWPAVLGEVDNLQQGVWRKETLL